MKACLICPAERPAVSALAQIAPLANLPLLGKSLLEYWLEHLASLGATQVQVLAADRPDLARAVVGNGARWGFISAEVSEEMRELPPLLARAKYPILQTVEWLPEPFDMVSMTHFPGQPEHPLFASYADWFAALFAWLPHAATLNRIGVREVQPGVWAGMRSHIAPSAQLRGPCWIGEGSRVGPRSVIGPKAIVEDYALIESDCQVTDAVIGPQTLVGKLAEVKDSFAWGGTLINWKTGSITTSPDPFFVCALGHPFSPRKTESWRRQLAAVYARNKEELQLLWDQSKIKLP